LVTRDDAGRVTVLAWQPVGGTDDPVEPERHELRLSVPVPGSRTVYAHRSVVNDTEGNAWAALRDIGRPASPPPRHLAALDEAAEPARSHRSLEAVDGRVALDLTLGRHEVTHVELDAVHDETPPWLDDSRILGRGPYGT